MKQYEFINGQENHNGSYYYTISICHHFGEKEFFQVHYSWKNSKRSMFNLTMPATDTLEDSIKLMEKKIEVLEEKICL